MYIDSFNGEKVIKTKDELLVILGERSNLNANYFILTYNDSGFPQLSLFVKDNLCVAYYLGDKGDSYVSYNLSNKRNDTYSFYEDANNEVEIAYECVLDAEILNSIACDFFEMNKRPSIIKWKEL